MMKLKLAKIWSIYSILFFIIVACTPEAGEIKTYIYTVKNESGVKIKIIGYSEYNHDPNIINLENGEELTKTYKDGVPPRGYDFKFFFSNSGSRADSLRVIYNNTKYKDYNYRNKTDERNPIFNLTGNTIETYTFTINDYENAENCNSNCD